MYLLKMTHKWGVTPCDIFIKMSINRML